MVFATLRAWKGRHPVWFELILAIALGILIEAALVGFNPPTFSLVRRVADDTADKMIRLAEATTSAILGSPAFVLVDIDDESWQAMGSPNVVPRKSLAALLAHAAASKPLAIVLD